MTEASAELANELSRIVKDHSRKVYPLLDGSAFPDLPKALAKAGLAHRSLFLNIPDRDLARAGPWLIDPYHGFDPQTDVWGGGAILEDGGRTRVPATLSEFMTSPGNGQAFHARGGPADPAVQLHRTAELAGPLPAAIFWIGGEKLSEAALWRHLRTLNNVLIPKGYGQGSEAPDQTGSSNRTAQTHEPMIFRHGDGNVLAEVLPVLDEAQFARLFGPASSMVFLAPDHPGSKGSALRRALLPDPCPPSAPGLLKMSMDQMRGVEEARLGRSSRRVAQYLRRAAPEQTASLDDAALLKQTAGYISEARQQGVRSEASLGKYCYLQFITKGQAGSQSGVREYFSAKDSVSMDDKVALVLKSVILAARKKEQA